MRTSRATSFGAADALVKISFLFAFIFMVLGCSKDSDGDSTDDQVMRYTLTVAINPANSGTVTPSGGSHTAGTNLSLQATPSMGYEFSEWTGSVQSTNNPVAVTMNSNKSITANFEMLDSDGDGVTDLDDDCPDTPQGEPVDDTGCIIQSAIYLDENGITIKAYEWAEVGDTATINGTTYIVVNEIMLRDMIASDQDVRAACTTKVTDMRALFANKPAFNGDIGSWDVSHVTNMSLMFSEGVFDQDIGAWDVGKVTDMHWMFEGGAFNQDIGQWDVSSVTKMYGMFSDTPFNQDISAWDVSNVMDMRWLFEFTQFNQPIGTWDVSSVTDMGGMFTGAPFNQDISAWDVSQVTDMKRMFYYTPFDQDISSWDVSKVTNMSYMFAYASFNQDIGMWNVSSVTTMEGMFNNLDIYVNLDPNPFDQDISSWDVSSVINMAYMFAHSSFNQDLRGWNVANVTGCEGFNRSSTAWILPKPDFTNCDPN